MATSMISVATQQQDLSEAYHELEKFVRLQKRLEDRKQYIYDMVCYLVEADNAAPKFHLKSNDTIYDRSYKGILSDVPPVLVFVEEDFDPDDTITNYDEVLFLMCRNEVKIQDSKECF